MADFRKDKQFFYCPDYKAYVVCDKGMFYKIEGGKLVFSDFYSKILIGDIYYEDITEEEFNAQLSESA